MMTERLKKRFILIVTLSALLMVEYLFFRPEDVDLWLVVVGCVVTVAAFLLPVYANTNGEYGEYFAIKNSKVIVLGLLLLVAFMLIHEFSPSEKIENLLFIPFFGAYFVYLFCTTFRISEERKKLHQEGKI